MSTRVAVVVGTAFWDRLRDVVESMKPKSRKASNSTSTGPGHGYYCFGALTSFYTDEILNYFSQTTRKIPSSCRGGGKFKM